MISRVKRAESSHHVISKHTMKSILFILIIGVQQFFAQNSNLLKGNDFFNKLGYAAAIPYFEKVQGTELESTELNEKLAYCYLFTSDLGKAESFYKKLISIAPKADYYYHLGFTQLKQGKSKEALENLQLFSSLNPNDSRAVLFATNPSYLEELLTEKPSFNLVETNINSKYDDFGVYPYPRGNGAVIVSGRNKTGLGGKVWAGDDQNFLELFFTQTGSFGMLTEPIRLEKPMNSMVHDGPICFSNNGNLVYFTSNNREKSNKDGKGIQQLKIYIADVIRSEWVNIREFKHNSANYACGHPTLSLDGKTLYFVSDMPGGFGGADIYRCSLDANGQFGKPENMGSQVNTSGQELFPWIGNDNHLYFSSDGRPGLGGMDIFVIPTNASVAAKNVGQPVNSMSDDFALTFQPDSKFGYVSSDRKGSDDIFSIEQIIPFTFKVRVKGKLMDTQSNTFLANCKVELKDKTGKVIATTTSSDNGEYSFEVDPESSYVLVATQTNYKESVLAFKSSGDMEQLLHSDITLTKKPSFGIGLLISDKSTNKMIEGAQIKVTDLNRKSILLNGKTGTDGKLETALNFYKIGEIFPISIEILAPGYLTKSVNYSAKFDTEGIIQLHERIDLKLQAINVGEDLAKMLNIKPIYFDLNKFNIRKDAAIELDKIIKVMNENPNMVIELGSHTDCRGTLAANETLSQNRASSSANYIKQRISNPSRISGKGYGETKLINDCGCEGTKKSTCSEKQHQENRRTEFIIVKM